MNKISLKDKNYPELLKKIPNPPKELYFNGILKKSEKYPFAVVGTRKPSAYGQEVTEYFVKNLSEAGLTIVSGLALGIDSLAHKIALENKGKTIAVLGSGLNHIYPQTHQKLAKEIVISGGALISEYPPETLVYKGNFPARNRIISGLSLGVLIIEAPEKSGALITAHYATLQKRRVFVVPGRFYDKNSVGANELIKQGAQLVSKPEEILKTLKIKPVSFKKQKIDFLSEEEKLLLKFLDEEPVSIDEIIKQNKKPASKIISCLTSMEMKGVIKNLGGQYIGIK